MSSDKQPDKPPKPGTFKPGTSGNPSGRPKDVHHIQELARGYAPRCVERLWELTRSHDPKVALHATVALLDRGCGRPHQTVHVTERPMESEFDLSRLSEAEVEQLLALRLKAGAAAGEAGAVDDGPRPEERH